LREEFKVTTRHFSFLMVSFVGSPLFFERR